MSISAERAGGDLEVTDAHLVISLLAEMHVARGQMWVLRIVRRVVVPGLQAQLRSSRQPNGFSIDVMLLPIETPVVDRDERDDGAIRQDGRHFHFASQLVHVRSHVEQIGVHRQHVRRADVLLAAPARMSRS